MEKIEEIKRKVVALAEGVKQEWESGKKSDEEFKNLSMFEQDRYLKKMQFLTGKLDTITQVLQIMGGLQ